MTPDLSDEAIAALCVDLEISAERNHTPGESLSGRALAVIEALAHSLDETQRWLATAQADLDAERAKVERLWLAGSALLAHANEVDRGGWSERNEMANTLAATEPTS